MWHKAIVINITERTQREKGEGEVCYMTTLPVAKITQHRWEMEKI